MVNYISAPAIAKERGIKVTETISTESEDYLNLITMRVTTTEGKSTVAGTIFGKKEARVVRINTFRLEMIPQGHLALIQNIDKPGSIGEIGTILGEHNININRMQVGQEEDGDHNIIFLCTDIPISPEVAKEIQDSPLVKNVTPLEL